MNGSSKAAALTPRDRLALAGRIVAATAGGYAVAALAAIALGTVLPVDPGTATIVSTLVGPLLMPVAAMTCFRVRSAARAWVVMSVAAAACAAVALAGGWRA